MNMMALYLFGSFGEAANSPFVVPVAGCLMILGIVVANVWQSIRRREIASRERLECIARGIAPPPLAEELAVQRERPLGSLQRRRANLRLTGIILLAGSLGVAAFFVALTIILQEREVLSGAACALVPLAMGLGFLYDTRIQTKEIGEAAGPGEVV